MDQIDPPEPPEEPVDPTPGKIDPEGKTGEKASPAKPVEAKPMPEKQNTKAGQEVKAEDSGKDKAGGKLQPQLSMDQKEAKAKRELPVLLRQLNYLVALVWDSLKVILFKFVHILDTTDVRGTIQSIHSGIELKGYNIWILISSAVLACIGLDQDSGAVIIGAMLISPLMSPIMGIGLSVGMNDRPTMLKSTYNFGVAVAISLITATIYFYITPLGQPTDQILARVRPNVLDVMVGFFGGVAGIVAGSRKEKTNAIPGVAIATALMPPLCVSGYGLATGQYFYFFGSFYLFFLNVVFISFATFLVVRFLNFPLVAEVTLSLRKNFLRGTIAFVILMMVPAVWLFIDVIGEQRQQSRIQEFISEKFPVREFAVEKCELLEEDSVRTLQIVVAGHRYIPEDSTLAWEQQLEKKTGLKDTELILLQTQSDPNEREQLWSDVKEMVRQNLSKYDRDRKLLDERNKEVAVFQERISELEKGSLADLEIRDYLRDVAPELVAVDFGQLRSTYMGTEDRRLDPGSDDRRYYFFFTWPDSLKEGVMEDRKHLLEARLRNKYKFSNYTFMDLNEPHIIEASNQSEELSDEEEPENEE